jgi:hypothetical protein
LETHGQPDQVGTLSGAGNRRYVSQRVESGQNGIVSAT